MRCIFAIFVLISAMIGEEFVRLDLPLSKPFGLVKQPIAYNVKPSYTDKNRRNTSGSAKKMATDQSFVKLAKVYANSPIEFEKLKSVTLAMMMLESGRGSSDLAKKHNNFGGLKYRPEMANFAAKVRYNASDGYDYYCEFNSIEAFVEGFWIFLDRKPYTGWRKKAFNERAFLEFIAPIYCPYNKEYVTQVMKLLPEARMLLDQHSENFAIAEIDKLK
ncbi:hypothetical protein FACS189487_08780 [Campylobacterota bacterium]|nr:hypothetical protein FACS189487_08780 [Campylobacterota bacterium]